MNENNFFRLFIAIDMPPAVIDESKRLQKVLQKQDLFGGRFTDEHQMHITLKFIGDVASQDVESVKKLLQKIKFNTLPAHLGPIDVFTRGKYISVIFLPIICPQLIPVVEQINQLLLPWCEKEKRTFTSHITLARVKKVDDVPKLLDAIRCLKITPIEFTIDSFILKQSVLKPTGPIYNDLALYNAC